MKPILALVLGFTLFCDFLLPNAEAFEFSFVGAGTFSTPSIVNSGVTQSGISSKIAFGGGLLLGFDLSTFTELEIGGLYVGRHDVYSIGPGQGEDSYSSVEIPVLLRIVPVRYFSVGGGAYYSMPRGNDTNTVTAGGVVSTTAEPASNIFKNDLGVVASAAIKFPLGVASDFLVDGRYYYGLVNTSMNAGETLKNRDLQVLAGFSFGF